MCFCQVGEARTAVGSGLVELGVQPGAHIGIYSVNCVEWAITDHACQAYSMVPVPLYDTLGPEAVEFICDHAEISVVFCSGTVLKNLLASIQNNKEVKLVVVFGLGSAGEEKHFPSGGKRPSSSPPPPG